MQLNISRGKIILKFLTMIYLDLSSSKYLVKLLKKLQKIKYINIVIFGITYQVSRLLLQREHSFLGSI